ncbi:pyridoxal phosphate-dependent aminotransferase [Andreprevotia chitinilytica]|uniref:pyridoxal phosphate-dependent aminotransferase n=1 Tax=Andreprevotia chitinilytica TaxID=396808 RepID=UPI00068B4E89|nr:aminotransferase class I/II-fold pyridoxal phosphate-dependent enzyme [Andreprevotia chitinilytica]
MDWSTLVAPQLRALKAYQPGITAEKLRRESGLTEVFKFSSNEAPIKPSPLIEAAMCAALGNANRYPDAQALLDKLAEHLGVPVASLALGNGSIDLIEGLVRLFVSAEHNVVLSEFGYSAYPAFVLGQGAKIRIARSGANFGHDIDNLLAQVDADTRLLLIDSPTNLSGAELAYADITRLLEQLPPHVVVVLDEAYAEFAGNAEKTAKLPQRYPNVVITRTFSKAYGLAGLRVGYAIADAGLLGYFHRIRPPFPVGGVALAGALAALEDSAHLALILNATRSGRQRLLEALAEEGVTVVAGTGNFVLADFGPAAKPVYEGLLALGFITRAMSAYGLPTHIRISIGAAAEIEMLIVAIAHLLQAHLNPHADQRHSALVTS